MIELVIRTGGLLSPAPGGPRIGLSAEAVKLFRDGDGRVRRSRRLADPPLTPAFDTVREVMGETARALGAAGNAAVQSVVAEVRELPGAAWRRTRVLARVETVAGPVLAGAETRGTPAGEGPRAALRDLGARLSGLPSRLADPPAGWEGLPLVLAPDVAAVVVGGTWLVLTSRGGHRARERLAGRKVLPGITLSDLPSAHPPGFPDDAGRPAGEIRLVDGGVLRPREPEEATGALPGRAVWDHDRGALVPAQVCRVRVGGADAPPTERFTELVWCVEGVQRYRPDGEVWLTCLARVSTRPSGWFAVRLRGRPQRLLKISGGFLGEAVPVCTDSDVTTRALLLPSARELEEEGNGTVGTL
ncbi:hypothetical protein GCM10010517_72400 [Streptosporangium fragile]|uniref:Uncharacterized protein n=1 Tax=Streptosporangium fragile TaxID=46186 RepID=A0ABN3W9H0_9ACTN